MRTYFIILLSSLIILLFMQACSETPARTGLEEGISEELAKFRAEHIDSVHYSLSLDIPGKKEDPIPGKLEINLYLKKSVDLVLDFYSTNGKVTKVSREGIPVEFLDTLGHIVIPSVSIGPGFNHFEINFIAGDLSLNRNEDYLYTLLVPARASTVFPVIDQPDLKARFSLELKIPEDWVAQANGSIIYESIAEDGKKIVGFAPTHPISTYLFAFSAGKFIKVERTIEGRAYELMHRETDSIKVANNLDDIFALHASSLKWLEEYTGITYPFEKFGFTLIPSFQYGGMEHPGAIFYNASSLFLDENPGVVRQLSRASLIAHETAHMWFGDLVTMSWFNDVWLKEVFANFMAAKLVNPQFPAIDHDLRFVLSHYRGAYSVDRTPGSHPVRQELDNLYKAGSLYGPIIYQKAPILMLHLERLIGKEAMQSGLQEYLSTYSYGNATWDQLVEILDRKSEADLKEWSRRWVYEKGMPVFEIQRKNDVAVLLPEGNYGLQDIPFSIISRDTMNLTIKSSDSIISSKVGNESIVIPGSDGFSYGYFKLDPVTAEVVLRNNHSTLPLSLKASLYINMYESAIRKELPATLYLDQLVSDIKKERDEQILGLLLDQSRNLFWSELEPLQRSTFAPVIENALWEKMEQEEGAARKKTLFQTYSGIAVSEQGTARLWAVYEGKGPSGLVLSENDMLSLVAELAINSGQKGFEAAKKQLETIKNPDRKERFAFVLPSLSPDTLVRDAFFESLADESQREKEPWVQEALGYLNHPLREAHAQKYILPGLELLEEIQSTGDIFFPQRWLGALFSGHRPGRATEIVHQFLLERPDYDEKLRDKILQSVPLEAGKDWEEMNK